jgi:hypothetical protein
MHRDVFLKGKQVTQATGTYAYRAYLETLLNYGPSAKDSQLTSALYYKDTAGKMDIADPTVAGGNGNAGLRARYVFSKTSGTVEMTGPYSATYSCPNVNPSISVAHEIALKKGPAIYPICRVECKSFIVLLIAS